MSPIALRSDEQIGRYVVIEELGHGGMGVVLRAFDPMLQREVALKRVRTQAMDPTVRARMVREARAMARLNHPNVVAIFDVEVDRDRDQVVIAMEYVPGTTLRAWLDAERRPWPQIVRAFVDAGRGLVAAHAEGLLHRDFKPDNVLVGNDGRVRVTDFGLARMTGSRRSDSDGDALESVPSGDDEDSIELTQAGYVVGTPPYMAPEQHERGELDPRTDQYAFCVALWHALTRRWPFSATGSALAKLKRRGAPAWPRDIVVPGRIADAVRRGLSPEPSERWPSLQALLTALQRDVYRRSKIAGVFGAIAIVALGGWIGHRVRVAQVRTACGDEGDRIATVWNDARADRIAAAFHETGLSYADASWARARESMSRYAEAWREARVEACDGGGPLRDASRACMDELSAGLEALLAQLEQADAQAVQRSVMASASLRLVAACKDEALLRHQLPPPSDPVVRERVAALQARLARSRSAHATGHYDEALEHAQAVLAEASEVSWVPLVIAAKNAIGEANERLGRYLEATAALEEAFFEATAAGRDAEAFSASTTLVFVVGYQLARHDEGLRWARSAETLVPKLGPSQELGVAQLLAHIGNVEFLRGSYDAAVASFERALAMQEHGLGPDHPRISALLMALANAHYARGEHARALDLHARSLAVLEHATGPEHPDVATLLGNIGNVYAAKGDYAQAIDRYRRAVEILEGALGPNHAQLASMLINLGHAHRFRGELDDALRSFERARPITEAHFGPEHPVLVALLTGLGTVHRARHDDEQALALYRQALALAENTLGTEHPNVAVLLHNIGNVLAARGELDEAIASLERAQRIHAQSGGPESLALAETCEALADARLRQGDVPQAIADYERALAIHERNDAPASELASTRFGLARALWTHRSDRPRAIALATAALDGSADDEHARDEVQRWLAKRSSR